tara:strand:- start:353 stop:727 length:375 start_codon:yes stop_codon:yes gene_type:complete
MEIRLELKVCPPIGMVRTDANMKKQFALYIEQHPKLNAIAGKYGVTLSDRVNDFDNFKTTLISHFDNVGDEICASFGIGSHLKGVGIDIDISYLSDIADCVCLIKNHKHKYGGSHERRSRNMGR